VDGAGGKLETSDYMNRPKDTSDAWYNVFETLLRREVIEETSLTIRNIRYLTDLVFIRPDGIPTIVMSLFAYHESGEVKLCEDLTEHAWVSLEEARIMNLIDGIYEELEMLDKLLRGKIQKSEKRTDYFFFEATLFNPSTAFPS